ncbi:MAG: hypothetical protein PHG41_07590 [Actinomycetota bacterium]|nr:hypothetical protein [Actinomycetota bacterium]
MNNKKNKLSNLTKEPGNTGIQKNYESITSGKDKDLIREECRENYNFKKEVVIKEDGRYLIYYEF